MSSDIITICNTPNRGFMTLVFTDDGVRVSTRCKIKDVYEGIIPVIADLLLDIVHQTCPLPDLTDVEPTEEGFTDDLKSEVNAYGHQLVAVHEAFTESLKNAMIHGTTVRQLTAQGCEPEAAEELTRLMEAAASEQDLEEEEDIT